MQNARDILNDLAVIFNKLVQLRGHESTTVDERAMSTVSSLIGLVNIARTFAGAEFARIFDQEAGTIHKRVQIIHQLATAVDKFILEKAEDTDKLVIMAWSKLKELLGIGDIKVEKALEQPNQDENEQLKRQMKG